MVWAMTNPTPSAAAPASANSGAGLPSSPEAMDYRSGAQEGQPLRTALDRLLEELGTTQNRLLSDDTALSYDEIAAIARDIERVRRAADVIAAAHARRVRESEGNRPNSLATYLSEITGAPKQEMFGRLATARFLEDPLLGPALRAHAITSGQARGIADVARKFHEVVDQTLIDAAVGCAIDNAGTTCGADLGKRLERELSAHLPADPEDKANKDHQHKSRTAHLGAVRANGMSRLQLQLTRADRTAIELLSARASALAAKQAEEARGNPAAEVTLSSHDQVLYDLLTGAINASATPSATGTPSAASATSAADDTSAPATSTSATSTNAPTSSSTAAATPSSPVGDLVIRLDPRDLVSPERKVATSTGSIVTVAEALTMAAGRPHWLAVYLAGQHRLFRIEEVNPDEGATQLRFATSLQRLLLFATYETCMWDGCDEPAVRCQVHHVREWHDGGLTEIANLSLVCASHHGRIHNGPGGFQFRFRDGPPGYPPQPQWDPNPTPAPFVSNDEPPPF